MATTYGRANPLIPAQAHMRKPEKFGLKPRPEEGEEGVAPEETSEVAEGQEETEKVE